MKVELKSIKIYEKLSEETTAFSADIYIDGRKAGEAKNDGHGGCTDYYSFPGFNEAFRKLEIELPQRPELVYPKDNYGNEFKVKCTFENWIDYQVANKLNENNSIKLEKDCKKYICIEILGGYKMIGWKNHTVTELLGTPSGKNLLQTKILELKSSGEVILNKNLGGLQL